ncbi:MAG: energy-coupling factor transporter transmembrane component T [Bulleidia sp.]
MKKELLDPRTKFLLIFAEAFLVLGAGGGERLFWFRAVFSILPSVLLLLAGCYSASILGLAALGCVHVLECMVFPCAGGPSAGMLLFALMLADRFLPAFLMGKYVLETTTVSAFKAAMDKLHMPDALTIPMCVMFRLFPAIRQENNAICCAMKMRGIGLAGGKPGKMLEYRIVPMVVCTAKIGEELSASALTRGLGRKKKRTNICSIGFGWADWIIFLLTAAAVIIWVSGVFS